MALVESRFASSSAVAEEPASVVRSAALSVRNVLFTTDFSATSEAALPYATAISRHFGSTLHAVHVLSDASLLLMTGGTDYVSMGTIYEDAHNEAKDKLEQICGHCDDIPHRCHVRHGGVWKNLAGIIEENHIDLIVVGTHGRTGLGKLLLGSVAEDILRHASCPVLTVGPEVSGRAKLPAFESKIHDLAPLELELQQIVYATSFAKDGCRVAERAIAMAAEFRSRLTLLHVIADNASRDREPSAGDDCVRKLREMVPSGSTLQYLPEPLLEFGSAPERILKVAAEREADLIALGVHSSAEMGTTHLPWSAAHRVISRAHCPVLTVRE